ncbi:MULTISPECIES: 3-isopropylmalate dehydratase small subunit [Spirulina sp. CCY15215]|uniref:3-isopropylmalate dehydratase small subunit n=1 Tax=Spirulina sp. CCY15215 TaxID=2767591 RepID=UPI00194E377A|nr:3-isopropylmalate dehydratase small subunit [Spirulina major]
MSEVKTISGRGIPLKGNDIDTDRIIPARFLRCVTFDGLGEQVFADDRQQTNGEHPFDQPQYQGANILIANGNFGCGSSREHAPQALLRWGIQTIIGESFAEIFLGNCVALGIPCVIATPKIIAQLQAKLTESPKTTISVNLENKEVRCDDLTVPVQIGEGIRQMFLTGKWDSCGQLTANAEQVKTTAANLPYIAWAS